jgi:hypothetical protein
LAPWPRRGCQRSGNGEKREKDCGPNTIGEAAANAATPEKDDGTTQTEQRRSCNENRPPSRMATLPRIQRMSAVTLTLSERAKTKTSYAEIIATARRSIPLTEIGVKSIGMRKAVTGAIIIQVPDDKGKEKALQLATHLTKVLDPTAVKVAAPPRTAELKIVGIDISIEKEELRQALALAAECGVAEIQVRSEPPEAASGRRM